MARQRDIQVFSMSFLDLLCVGLGAVTLMLLIFMSRVRFDKETPRGLTFVKVEYPYFSLVKDISLERGDKGGLLLARHLITERPRFARHSERGLTILQTITTFNTARSDPLNGVYENFGVNDQLLQSFLFDRGPARMELTFRLTRDSDVEAAIAGDRRRIPAFLPKVTVNRSSGESFQLDYGPALRRAFPRVLKLSIKPNQRIPQSSFGVFVVKDQ